MVKFGINTFLRTSPFTSKNLDLIEKGRAFGFDVVEIPIEGDAEIDEKRLADAFHRAGVGRSICAVMGAGRDPSDPDPDAQQRALEYMTRCIDIASAAGPKMVAALGKIGYNGTLVIESFSTEVKEIAREAAVWRPLAPSPDELARRGLAFLKQTFVQ